MTERAVPFLGETVGMGADDAVEAGPVPSPCVDICRLDEATGWCVGCGRTMDEISAWARLDDAARRRVWALLPARRETLARSER
jgi:predicted Fe-S protein YdhL (DUF1289 family)